jgi:hypothetical protein
MKRGVAGTLVTLALTLIVLGPAIALAAAPASEQLAGTLLTAEDLPAGMAPSGVGDASTFSTDSANLEANGGTDVVEQTWEAAAQDPVYRVFDFRFQLPTPEAAQTYLDAAEPVLSEAASGLTPVADDIEIGDGYRHYARQAVSNGQTLELHNILFRVGPIVAKVFVGGYGTTSDDVLAIAKAAHDRIAAAAPPVAVPAPTLEPTPDGSAPSSGINQWAVAATASTEFGSSGWSAQQATGSPDVTSYADDQLAWTPKLQDGTTEWLDLRYEQAVVPTAVSIHESFNPGFVTKVEAFDTAAATWVTLWQGTDPTPSGDVGTFTPALATTDVAVDRIRVTIDTDVPDWNEIDAVELVGTPPD